ncbi:hypothetical protein [Campylobacter taeniopygiae]|uniref:hypothetical protein n=1 Tax=Campylobacter taeniopygiae TaxID=2510188 RepID=UPI003D6A16E3
MSDENKKLNVILFGTCDMIWNGSFVAGLKESGAKVTTFAHSNICAASHIYNLKRKRNQKIIEDADLIILGISEELGDEQVYKNNIRNFLWLYKELYFLNKKVVVIVWHYFAMYTEKYNNFHQSQCYLYGFNLIDIYGYCKENKILDFYLDMPNYHHPLPILMKKIAYQIVLNVHNFKLPKKIPNISNDSNFTILDLEEFYDKDQLIKARNHLGFEYVYKVDKECFFKFPTNLEGKKLLSIHTMNYVCNIDHAIFVCRNRKYKFAKISLRWETFPEIYCDFEIDSHSYIDCKYDERIEKQERWFDAGNNGIGIVGFLLADNIVFENFTFDISEENYDQEYDCNYFLTFLTEWFYFINDYKNRISIQESTPNVNDSEFGTAKARIQNQLSYKLGQAMMENSKSILGYIRMPYVLSYIKDKHKQEQKKYEEKIKKDPSLKLPPLESYPDYEEALNFKEHLSYKLGEALIRANNNWYGGGYIKLWFEIRKLKKEFYRIK